MVASLLLSGCSSQHTSEMERKLINRSLDKHPSWITSLPNDPDYFYTVGISENAPSLRQGRLIAARDAAIEVSNYLGLRASGRFEVETTELTTRIVNEMTVTTSARFERASLSQMYYEEYHHAGTEEAANVFDVYVLLRIPMAELLQEQEKRKLKREAILSEAKVISREAAQHFSAGNFPIAWQKWILSMRLLDEEMTGSVSSLQIYKTLLTAVEGIRISLESVNEVPAGKISGKHGSVNASSVKEASSSVIARASFIASDTEVPLKGLPLYFRLEKDKGSGEIKKTDLSGRIRYDFATPTEHGLELRMVMAPYVVDRKGLSPQLSQKISFLEDMLERKVDQYGKVKFTQPSARRISFQAAVLTGEEGGLVEVSVASDNAYVLLDAGKKPVLTLKVDIMPRQSENMLRPPLNLSVVLDKSSSMHEENKIEYTKRATGFLIDNLTSQDYFSIVTYDSDVEVVVPAGPVLFKSLLKHRLSEIEPDGMTNLSGGLFEGYTQVKRNISNSGVNRILLLSDGKANQGVTSSDGLIAYTKRYGEEGIAVTALGVGQDFNEALMMGLAESSNGNYYYIKNSEDIPEIFSQELTRLINVAAQNAQVKIILQEGVYLSNSFGQPYKQISHNEYQFRLGDINYGGRGILLLELELPLLNEGEHNPAVVEVSYDDTGGKGKVGSTKQISIIYTHDANKVASSKNLEVEKYVLLTRSIEQLEKVLQSLDRGLYEEAKINMRKTYTSLEQYARASEDPEFLQRMRFLKHFEHEIEALEEAEALHEHDESLIKDLGYQLYLEKHSHRSLSHPLHR